MDKADIVDKPTTGDGAGNRVVVFVEFDEAEYEAVRGCADGLGVPVEALARTLLAANGAS